MGDFQPLITTNIEKVAPHNLEAEQATLGALLIDKESITKIADLITTDDFYSDVHAKIFDAMMSLYTHRVPIDVLALANVLTERKDLDVIGGRAYLTKLANVVPTSSHVVSYATIVQRKATLRRLIRAANDILGYGYQERDDVDELLDQSEQALFTVSQRYLKQNFIPIKTLLNDAFDRMDEIHKGAGKLRGLPTNFIDLDNLLAGLQASDLVILAARPSVGKTALALDIARQAATKHKAAVGIFSLEMSKEQLIDRMLCSEAGISLWRFRTGRLTDHGDSDDFSSIGQAMGRLSEAPIFIDDSGTANIMEIRTKARRLKAEHGLDLLVVDYLQLMEGRRTTDNRVQEVSEITRGLKAIARELNIPVLALSQLARSVELSKPAIPKLSHLRESGSIEQDADVVMFIYRKAADRNYRPEEIRPEERTQVEIHVAKHRNGPTGTVNLRWNEDSVSFRNADTSQRTEEPPPAAPF